MRDLKWIMALLVVCILLLVAVSFFIPSVSAFGITQNMTNTSTIERITQGSIVYLNETYDIGGVTGWTDKLAWYGKYSSGPEEGITPYIINLPSKTHTTETSQYYYTIDNATFSNHPGYWFQYYGENDYKEVNGNLLAFKVVLNKPVHFNQTNISGVISYDIYDNSSALINAKPFVLPEVNVSEYLVARGDSLSIPVNESSSAWVFGRLDYLYDNRAINNSIELNGKVIKTLEPGSYTLLMQTPIVPNTDFTIKYNRDKNEIDWFDPTMFAIHSESLNGYSPLVTLSKLQEIFPSSHDKFTLHKLQVEDPSISIMRIDQVYKNGTQVLDVRGYTNTAKGTIINMMFDEDKQNARTINQYTYKGIAQGNEMGNMRYYQIYVPITLDETPNGMHTLSATTAIGGKVSADFLVSEMPPDSYIPNALLKYIGDRNPWVPTPTPEVIIKKEMVPVPGPVVTVIVTPSNEQVRAQQEKIIGENNNFWIPRIITAVIILIVLLYLVSVHLRRKEH